MGKKVKAEKRRVKEGRMTDEKGEKGKRGKEYSSMRKEKEER